MIQRIISKIKELYGKYKGILIPGLILVCFVLSLQTCKKSRQIRNLKGEKDAIKLEYSLWRDSVGREHAKFKQETYSLTQLQSVQQAKLDTVASTLKIAKTDINEFTEIISGTSGSYDSKVSDNKFKFGDKYFNMDGDIDQDSSGLNLSVKGKYKYSDKGTIVSYTRKKKFLGITVKKEVYMDVYFDNPNTKIEGLDHIKLDKYIKPKRWGIGPNVNVTYHNGKVVPTIGVGVQYNVIRF